MIEDSMIDTLEDNQGEVGAFTTSHINREREADYVCIANKILFLFFLVALFRSLESKICSATTAR